MCFHSTRAESKALELFYEYGVTALPATEKMEVISLVLFYFLCMCLFYYAEIVPEVKSVAVCTLTSMSAGFLLILADLSALRFLAQNVDQ